MPTKRGGRSKYRNIRTKVDGIEFASKKEAARYSELRLLERAGKISGLKLQVPYPIEINHVKICTYRADFVYLTRPGLMVEDVKGAKTPLYRLKKKLMRAIYGIEILET
jgi:hypothetical protein